uniref:Photosystem II protein M n=1 Tax=Aphyllon fasciculatum TaxID=48537 RepID=A0A385Y7S9_APHFC|nr:photosystem II protein M [Aphyllon fasciculatum]AYC21485.1 photosystem II protein M [Aphyllon fasciculatum]
MEVNIISFIATALLILIHNCFSTYNLCKNNKLK